MAEEGERASGNGATGETGSEAPRRRGAGPIGYVEAFALGIKDTAGDMLRAGRAGAAETYDEMWARYEAKTKQRRKRKGQS